MKTYTPDLARLRDYAALFADDFPQAKPVKWAGVYLHGLLTDGDRKSVEPLSRRVELPDGLTSKDPEQALQQFVSHSPWDPEAVPRHYRAHLAAAFADSDAVFVIDDTTFPKQGRHSVGVQRQYCGALGKKANCQAAVTVHYVAPRGHYPLALRLFLPEAWVADPARLDRAGVPEEHRRERTKGQIALDLLDRVRSEGLPGRVVLPGRGLHYIAGGDGRGRRVHRPAGLGQTRRTRWGRAGRGSTAVQPPVAAGLAPPGPAAGPGGRYPAPAGHLAGRDEGPDVRPVRLGAGVAGVRVEAGRACHRGPGLAADRGAGRRRHQVRPLEPAGRDELPSPFPRTDLPQRGPHPPRPGVQ